MNGLKRNRNYLFLLSLLLILCLFSGLTGQSIIVTGPKVDETLCLGSSCLITWSSTGMTDPMVRIRLRDVATNSLVLQIVEGVPKGSGMYSWTIPSSLAPGRYLIRVRSTADGLTDGPVVGDGPAFTISACPPAAGTISVQRPAAGEVWEIGKSYPITWTTSNLTDPMVRIRLRTSPGDALVQQITEGVSKAAGIFNWTIPREIIPGTYSIRVRSTPDGLRDGPILSDSPMFTIKASGSGLVVLDSKIPSRVESLPLKKVEIAPTTLSPTIHVFKPQKPVLAMGEPAGLVILFSNGDEAVVKEVSSGKEFLVSGIRNGRFDGIFHVVPHSNGSVQLELTVKNRLMSTSAKCSLIVKKGPEIERFEPVAQIIKPGTAATFSVGFRNAERARLLDGSSGLAVWDNTVRGDFAGTIQTPVLSQPSHYTFTLEVSSPVGLVTASQEIRALLGEPAYSPAIQEFRVSPATVRSVNDTATFHYRYSRAASAVIVNMENGQKTILPVNRSEISGSRSIEIPFTSHFRLYIENEYGSAERFEKVEVTSHPGPVIKHFVAVKEAADRARIEFEVWGAISLELFRVRSVNDSSKVKIGQLSGREPLKSTFTDDPLYYPVMYELRVVFPRGQIDTRYKTLR